MATNEAVDDSGAMFAAERRQRILQHAKAEGRVDAKLLSEKFNVTTETVRRDLIHLQEAGMLTRVHGGAVASDRLIPGVNERANTMSSEKWAIAQAAVAELPTVGSVIIDAGTTTSKLAALVPHGSTLSIMTNSLQVANTLVENARVDLLMLGGPVNRDSLATSDAWALDSLGRIAVDVAFVAATGLSAAHGVSTEDRLEAAVKSAMVSAAQRVIVLADHTKIGHNRMHVFARIPDIDLLITDSGIDPGDLDELREAGLKVLVAPARSS